MLTDAQIALLRDIGQSIAFSDENREELFELITAGYVQKVGDTYELTAKGEGAVLDHGAGLNEA
ncbi:hypothetical protein ACTGJ9_018085 [Bradyrhizobium sp. RDM12]